MKNIFNKITSLLDSGKEGANKSKSKKIENLIIIGVLGIVILISSNSIFKSSDIDLQSKEGMVENDITLNYSDSTNSDALEIKIEKVLSKIRGVGKVEVLISYENSGEVIYAYDIRENESVETAGVVGDDELNKSANNEREMVFEDYDNNRKPVIIKEISPKIKGAIIVAEGVNDFNLREDILRATSIILGISVHKIEVFERNTYK